MYSHAAVQIARDVTIWASEFDAHRVPPVCVKSGRPADGTWAFPFSPPASNYLSGFGAKRFRIPLNRDWLTGFTVLVAIRTVAWAIALPWFLASFFPNVAPQVRQIAFIAVWIGGAAALFFWLVQPRGTIHSTPEGKSWLLLVGVHPAFVDAVKRSRLPAAGLFSPDGKWFWDGNQWLNNEFPEQWWRPFVGAFERRPWWQVTFGMLVVWAGIGALAWWIFYRG